MALSLGASLGIIGVLCGRCVSDSPLLCTALQSAVSAMALAVLASARPQALALETQSPRTFSDVGHSSAQEAKDLCGHKIAAQPGCAPS